MGDETWEYILEIDECFAELEDEPKLYGEFYTPRKRTPEYYAARQRRVARLKELVERGGYWKPAELIAECFLYGRPEWGEALIDENGDRVVEI